MKESSKPPFTFRRALLWVAVVVAVAAIALVLRSAVLQRVAVHLATKSQSTPPSEDRVAIARAHRGAAIRKRCLDAGLTYPPKELFLRAFKMERQLEAWGRGDDGSFHLVATWPVLAASGHPGPKRREGDLQVPEGCYQVVVFNPLSSFHLSLGLDYPNASDLARSDHDAPGSDIYIHGGAASIGCLAIGDDAIDELFLLAKDTKDQHGAVIPVHIFPMRMNEHTWETFRASHPQQQEFWAELEPIYTAFERNRQVPHVAVDEVGRYALAQKGS